MKDSGKFQQKHVKPGTTFCPDCKYCLIWERIPENESTKEDVSPASNSA